MGGGTEPWAVTEAGAVPGVGQVRAPVGGVSMGERGRDAKSGVPGAGWVAEAWGPLGGHPPTGGPLGRFSGAGVNSQCCLPGSSQQYLGQEEYYGGEQYGHSQAASEPLSQQYYPDGELRRSQSRPRHPNTRWQSSQSPLWGWGGGGHPALGGEVL